MSTHKNITNIIEALEKDDDTFEPHYIVFKTHIVNSQCLIHDLICSINSVSKLKYFLNYKDVRDIISKRIDGRLIKCVAETNHDIFEILFGLYCNYNTIDFEMIKNLCVIGHGENIHPWIFNCTFETILLLVQHKLITNQDIIKYGCKDSYAHCFESMVRSKNVTKPVADKNGILHEWFLDENFCGIDTLAKYAIEQNYGVELKSSRGVPILIYVVNAHVDELNFVECFGYIHQILIESCDSSGLNIINHVCLRKGKNARRTLEKLLHLYQVSYNFVCSTKFKYSVAEYNNECVEFVKQYLAHKQRNRVVSQIIKRMIKLRHRKNCYSYAFQLIKMDYENLEYNYETRRECGMSILWFLVFYEEVVHTMMFVDSGCLSSDMFSYVFADGKNIFHYVCYGDKYREMIEYFIGLHCITEAIVNATDADGKTPFDYGIVGRSQNDEHMVVDYFINSGKLSYKSFVDEYGIIDLRKFQNIQIFQRILNTDIIPCDVWNKVIVDKHGCSHSVITRNICCWDMLRYLLEQTDKITGETRNVSNGRVPIEME